MAETIKTIPLLPLRGLLVFPAVIMHLDVGRIKSINALEAAMVGDRKILLASQKDAELDEPSPEEIYQTGTVAEVRQLLKLPGGNLRVLVEGLYRGRILRYTDEAHYMAVEFEELPDAGIVTPETEALRRLLVDQFEQWVKISKKIPPETLLTVTGVTEPGRLADLVAGHLALKLEEKQIVLDTVDERDRLNLLCDMLAKELSILDIEKKISQRVRKQMERSQKEYYLREQLKAINKELGDKDDKAAEIEEYRKRLGTCGAPKEAAEKIEHEIGRLEKMPSMTAETAVIRTYLDLLLDLPWNKETTESLDQKAAEAVLEEDHFGLEKVKERILEYLAIRSLAGGMKGQILCLVGPPGVGKTSLAKSVARAMERKFIRVSLGGIRDEAEIRGHRRTYIGAMPGRILQGIRNAESKNPVFLLDEVDKMNSDFRGDPSSALLEVLDPEQNVNFSDHYAEVSFDLSHVFWIVTANTTQTIPRPLLDRMEVIQIAGYTEEEKLGIAERYLVPKQMKEHGLKENWLHFSPEALRGIIRGYTREAGVRNLERSLATVCRKVARQIVQNKRKRVQVKADKLQPFLGLPKFLEAEKEREAEVGVVTGLAWTSVGGDVLEVEVLVTHGKGRLELTGQLGDVMKESAKAGYTYIRSRAADLHIDENFHESTDVHLHLPEGAIPKDGPSAGITMATALASALTGRKVPSDLAMTGEITLRGRVLPVGGIKEKMLAAHRFGIKRIILPARNERDLEELPAHVRKSLTFFPVKHMDEVLAIALEEKNGDL